MPGLEHILPKGVKLGSIVQQQCPRRVWPHLILPGVVLRDLGRVHSGWLLLHLLSVGLKDVMASVVGRAE